MYPRDLKVGNFEDYPSEARSIAVAHLALLQRLPLTFLPSLLREIIDYDYKFPAERSAIDQQLSQLSRLSPAQSEEWFSGFSHLSLSTQLEESDWVRQPAAFLEKLSASLWATHQMDAFRKAALDYGARLQAITPPEPLPARRLSIAVIGQGVSTYQGQLFRKLRPQGTLFTSVRPENGVAQLLDTVEARAKAHPLPYGHWYIDGGHLENHSDRITSVSYQSIEPIRAALLRDMQSEIQQPGMGPEELHSYLARLYPKDLGVAGSGNEVMDRFRLSLLTQGSGTQIYSTTFVQWTAREALRRAQPLTLFVRFAPRQRQRPMNELLSGMASEEPDFTGSLIDADMGAYYTRLNQLRLTGADQSVFLAWFEGHNQAVVVAPTIPRGTESSTETDLHGLLSWALA